MFKNLNQQWAHQLAVYKASHGIDPKEKREHRTTLLLEVSSCARSLLKVFTPGATLNHKFHAVMVYRKEITAKGMR